jgi:hypothetical protein
MAAPSLRPAFPWPHDSQAWWTFGAGLAGGWALSLGLHAPPAGLALSAAALGLFLASDWLSHLQGRSREGAVRPASAADPRGLALLALAAGGAALLLRFSPSLENGAWLQALTANACLVALMLILRLEWRPLDGRLLFLSHFILTLPILGLGFVAWGVGSAQALGLWILPGLYFPTQALFTQYWMEGWAAPRSGPSLIAAPLLAGILLQALRERWSGAIFLGFFLIRSVWLLQQRRDTKDLMPGFRAMRDLNRELQVWNVAALIAWVLGQI